jgi:mevalonate kinase
VILLGEHVVVYGRPALATGLPLGIDVMIDSGAGPRLISGDESDPRGARLVAEAARAVGLDPSIVVARVRSEVPPGRGLGSSAALCVATLRAAAAAAGRTLAPLETCVLGRDLERIFHGTPSGVDPATAALGACVRFVCGEPPTITPVVAPRPLRLLVAYGDRARSTGAAVGGLRERWELDRTRYERLFDEVATIVESGVVAVEEGDVDALGAAFERNQTLLAALGVSSPEIDALLASARAAGACGAKLTGGGVGGAIVAVARDVESVAARLRRTDVTTFVVDVGGANTGTGAQVAVG